MGFPEPLIPVQNIVGIHQLKDREIHSQFFQVTLVKTTASEIERIGQDREHPVHFEGFDHRHKVVLIPDVRIVFPVGPQIFQQAAPGKRGEVQVKGRGIDQVIGLPAGKLHPQIGVEAVFPHPGFLSGEKLAVFVVIVEQDLNVGVKLHKLPGQPVEMVTCALEIGPDDQFPAEVVIRCRGQPRVWPWSGGSDVVGYILARFPGRRAGTGFQHGRLRLAGHGLTVNLVLLALAATEKQSAAQSQNDSLPYEDSIFRFHSYPSISSSPCGKGAACSSLLRPSTGIYGLSVFGSGL